MYLKVNIEAINDKMLVPVIRNTSACILKKMDADQKSIDRMMLVVTEACSNVVRHAYNGQGTYTVELEYSVDTVHLTVIDYGSGFDVNVIPEPIRDIPQIGGYGIKFMKEESSVFVIESIPGKGTTLKVDIPITYQSKQYRKKIMDLPGF